MNENTRYGVETEEGDVVFGFHLHLVYSENSEELHAVQAIPIKSKITDETIINRTVIGIITNCTTDVSLYL